MLINELPDGAVWSSSGGISAIRALIAAFQGETKLSRVYSLQAMEEIPEKNQFMRSFAP
jgi:hypothetical protein